MDAHHSNLRSFDLNQPLELPSSDLSGDGLSRTLLTRNYGQVNAPSRRPLLLQKFEDLVILRHLRWCIRSSWGNIVILVEGRDSADKTLFEFQPGEEEI